MGAIFIVGKNSDGAIHIDTDGNEIVFLLVQFTDEDVCRLRRQHLLQRMGV